MRLAPSSWTTYATDSLRSSADQVLGDPRHDHEDPDQAVDDRRHRGQQPHDRLEHAAQPRRARTRR